MIELDLVLKIIIKVSFDYIQFEPGEKINNFYMTNEFLFINVDHKYVINSKLIKKSFKKMEGDKKCEVGVAIKSISNDCLDD